MGLKCGTKRMGIKCGTDMGLKCGTDPHFNLEPSGVTTMGSDRANPGPPTPMGQMGASRLRL